MTKRDVINMALDQLEIEAVDSSTNKKSALEKRASRWYDMASLYVLNFWEWSECIETTTFTAEASITNDYNDEYEYVYELPSDALRVIDLDFNPKMHWIVEGGYLYTNEYDATGGVICRYMKDLREEVNSSITYTEFLGECVALRLAYMLAPAAQKGLFSAMSEDSLYEAMEIDRHKSVNTHDRKNAFTTEIF